MTTTLQGSFADHGDRRPCLVVVFLRGGADGLELVPPVGDDAYYRARPLLGRRPADALILDGVFGLHPRLAPLKPAWNDGSLAIVHAAGSEDQSRSHFEAQDLMEHGGLAGGGWLGRFLRYRPRPAGGAEYPAGDFGHALAELARLIKARVGLEAASIDLGGWDSHLAQETLLEPLIAQLAGGLAAFARDLGPEIATTTVVVMTEFGRRVRENASLGTDHGRGSVMLVLGGGVRGGRVIGGWPGLDEAALEGPGDLAVAHNYRNVLAPVLRRHGAADGLSAVFPDFELDPLALF